VHLVGLSDKSKLNEGLYTISTELMSSISKTDLVIIPAMYGDLQKAIEKIKISFPG